MPARTAPANPRPRCLRCMRPVVTCFCAALTRIETMTRVVILQHPRERDMPIGTARMASLCLPNSRLLVGARWEGDAALAAELADPARQPVLLWPGAGARDVFTDPPRGPVTLVAIDGTWSQAKSVFRDNPLLHALPRYAFAAPVPSIYRIRREPRAEYVSTIEALMHVLGALEGGPERFRDLLRPMAAMIDAHLAGQAGARQMRFRKVRPRVPPAMRVPDEILGRPADLVCVAGESDSWRQKDEGGAAAPGTPGSAAGGDGDRAPRDTLVHWVARRVATGETFDVVARPPHPPARSTPTHAEIPLDRILGGVECADVFATFAAWLRPTDILLSWGDYGTRLYESCGGTLPSARIDLRAVARRISHGRGLTEGPVGSIEEYTRRIAPAAGDESPALPAGRAGRRVGMMVRIVGAWRAAVERRGDGTD